MMIRLVREPIDLAALPATNPADGALCLFVGVVRDHNGGRRVLRLEYEAYEEMALALMEKIAAECRERWRVTDVRIVHRLGRLAIGETSVAGGGAFPPPPGSLQGRRHPLGTPQATPALLEKGVLCDGAAGV